LEPWQRIMARLDKYAQTKLFSSFYRANVRIQPDCSANLSNLVNFIFPLRNTILHVGHVIAVFVSPSVKQVLIFKQLISVSFCEASRFFMNFLFPPCCSRNTGGHF
jgi:hypothetical protein